MITLFAVPKPFHGSTAEIQARAVRTWLQAVGPGEVLLLGNEEGIELQARRWGVRHSPAIRYSPRGTPLLDSILETANLEARYDTLCYVNADILLPPAFLEVIQEIRAAIWPALITGQRWDVDPATLGALPQDSGSLWQGVAGHAQPEGPHAMDYFVYPRGLWQRVPPFALGRTLWDNWLVRQAEQLGVPLVDASARVQALHQRHDYAHVTRGARDIWAGAETASNLRLLGGIDNIRDLRDARWRLTSEGLVPASRWQAGVRRFQHQTPMRQALRPFRQLKRYVASQLIRMA